MRLWGLARRLAAGLALAALCAAAPAGAWPNAEPAQPLVQASRVCASGVVPINRRCHVITFAKLGTFDGHDWYYAFYATHWADRHGKLDRGFPLVFYLQPPATLRLSLWVDDAPGLAGRWARTPPPPPILIRRSDVTFLGYSLKNVSGPADQRLFRLEGRHWRPVNVLRRSNADEALLDRTIPSDCEPVDSGLYDWTAFHLRITLKKGSGEACGAVIADLKPHRGHLDLTKAVLVR